MTNDTSILTVYLRYECSTLCVAALFLVASRRRLFRQFRCTGHMHGAYQGFAVPEEGPVFRTLRSNLRGHEKHGESKHYEFSSIIQQPGADDPVLRTYKILLSLTPTMSILQRFLIRLSPIASHISIQSISSVNITTKIPESGLGLFFQVFHSAE